MQPNFPTTIVADGPSVAVAGCGCGGEPDRVIVRRPGRPAVTMPMAAGRRCGEVVVLAVHGDLVVSAYVPGGVPPGTGPGDGTSPPLEVRLLEQRISTGATVMDVPDPGIARQDPPANVAVGDDGTVVVGLAARTLHRCALTGLVAVHPPNGVVRRLPVHACNGPISLLDGDRVSSIDTRSQVHVTAFDGTDRVALRFRSPGPTSISFDSDRAAARIVTCEGTPIRVFSLRARPVPVIDAYRRTKGCQTRHRRSGGR